MKLFYWITNLLDYIFTNEKCLVCKKPSNSICKDCILSLPKPQNDLPDHIHSLYEYRNPFIKKILTDAKYRGRFASLKSFDSVMHDAVLDIISEYNELNNYKNILLIPIPISKKRLTKRGYNQAEIIASSINRLNPNFILETKIVTKSKDRTPQASIHNKKERLKSPIGTFTISKDAEEKLKNSLCIIIDDIATTGATINEVRQLLIKFGAQNAIGLTIAH